MVMSGVERRAAILEANDSGGGPTVASVAAGEGGPSTGGDDGEGIGEQEHEQRGHRGAAAAVAMALPCRSSSEISDGGIAALMKGLDETLTNPFAKRVS